MEFTTVEDGHGFSDDCSTVILPALSIGNVGQLATDLLISSSKAKKVAFLKEPSVLPGVGNDAFGPDAVGELALPLEAFESSSHRLTLIQQRSPVVTGQMISYARNVADFISSIGKNNVVILSSVDSGWMKRIDASRDMQIFYISSSNFDGSDANCEKLGWKKLDEYDPSQRRWKYLASVAGGDSPSEEMLGEQEELNDSDYYAGLPFAALFSFCKAKGLSVTCLLCYCSEGDNIRDSFQLAQASCDFLGLAREKFQGDEPDGWVIPLSWRTVYGPPPDLSMF